MWSKAGVTYSFSTAPLNRLRRSRGSWARPESLEVDMTISQNEATYEDIGRALTTDYFFLREQLSEEQMGYLTRTRRFVDDEVINAIGDYWERADFPWPLVKRLGELGLVGDGLEGYGCPPMDPLSAGLVEM